MSKHGCPTVKNVELFDGFLLFFVFGYILNSLTGKDGRREGKWERDLGERALVHG